MLIDTRQPFEFTEANIRKIFGALDGEGESIDRLKEYYFKTNTFERVMADLPVVILVGQKGIGKSALFRIAVAEQKEAGDLPILIRPDDIAEIGEKHESLILTIKKWKFGLTEIIAKKVLNEFGLADDGVSARIIKVGGKIASLLAESIRPLKKGVNLLPAQQALVDKFLESNKITVYLDDLDRGWQNRAEGLIMISGLINSIRDMSSENPGLSFKLALRSDVYAAVRTGDESADKFDALAVSHSYTLDEIFVMLIKRVLTFFGRKVDEAALLRGPQISIASNLDSILEHTFQGRGAWSNAHMYQVILSLIRNRPRDLIKLCTMAAREAYSKKSTKIATSHIESILPNYSKSIIDDTIAEYKSELKDIERLLYGMKPNKKTKTYSESYVYTTPQLHTKLHNIISNGRFQFASENTAADAQGLHEFLYKINFITAKKIRDDGFIDRKNYEQANHLAASFKNFGYDWEVHLAYRWAIQAQTLDEILSDLSTRFSKTP